MQSYSNIAKYSSITRMSSILKYSLLIIAIFFITTANSSLVARAPFKPNAVFLATRRDNATGLHLTNIRKRTPQVSVPLVVDLNGRFLWVVCDESYLSSTYIAPICHSTSCSSAGAHYCHKCSSTVRPGCHNNTCAVVTSNPLTHKNAVSELAQDMVSISTGHGHHWATIPHFVFACAPSFLWRGSPLPRGAEGIAGLGHTPVALPVQLASRLGFEPQFSMCLGSPRNINDNPNGGIFFGTVPSNVRPKNLSYTQLTIGAQGEYFVLAREIIINNQVVPFNTSLLSTTRGFAGTMISTTTPYTVLEHSIYETFTQFFAHEMMGVPQVEAVHPFGLCFNATLLPPTRPGAPNIDFVFENTNVTWRVFGYDALWEVRPNVSCLAFVNGGTKARAPITFGAFMLENNFLHFDLLRSRLGFNPSRIQQPIDCSKFNFSGDPTVHTDVMGD